MFMVTMLFFASANSSDNFNENIAKHSAVILVYHHVSSSTPASTSISPEQFQVHLDYIHENFTVLPMKKIVDSLKTGTALPEHSVAITFDDGFENILHNAHTRLLELNMPYTIFVNPARVGKEKGQLNWQQLKNLQQQGVTIANHTLDHLHMLNKNAAESDAEWLQRVWANVENAQQQLAEQLGQDVPKWLAYPFGEYNQALANKVIAENYIGFAQHSGPVGTSSSLAALTRFPAAGIYANLNTLKTKLRSLAMPVSAVSPENPERQVGDKVAMDFTVQSEDVSVAQLQCFYKGESIETNITNKTVLITSDILLPVGRSRINCTAPSMSFKGQYYWYSQAFFLADSEGKYPN